MADDHRIGAVYWIDHYVVATNDILRWRDFYANVLGGELYALGGLSTQERMHRGPIRCFMEMSKYHHNGGFLQNEMMPPVEELGRGMPRYGYFIAPEDIDEHLRRLEQFEVANSGPIRTSEDGHDGTAIYFTDPDGNQLELWAPDRMPDGAMDTASVAKVGRVSHVVQESRDLSRTAEFYSRYCGLDVIESSDIPKNTLSLELLAGGRLVFKQVDELHPRTGSQNKWIGVHTALTVRDDEYLPAYQNFWNDLPESNLMPYSDEAKAADEQSMPPHTELHPVVARGVWANKLGRGTMFFDWDTANYHLTGGVPINGSMAHYGKPSSPQLA